MIHKINILYRLNRRGRWHDAGHGHPDGWAVLQAPSRGGGGGGGGVHRGGDCGDVRAHHGGNKVGEMPVSARSFLCSHRQKMDSMGLKRREYVSYEYISTKIQILSIDEELLQRQNYVRKFHCAPLKK